jgi:hypothetical protein
MITYHCKVCPSWCSLTISGTKEHQPIDCSFYSLECKWEKVEEPIFTMEGKVKEDYKTFTKAIAALETIKGEFKVHKIMLDRLDRIIDSFKRMYLFHLGDK